WNTAPATCELGRYLRTAAMWVGVRDNLRASSSLCQTETLNVWRRHHANPIAIPTAPGSVGQRRRMARPRTLISGRSRKRRTRVRVMLTTTGPSDTAPAGPARQGSLTVARPGAPYVCIVYNTYVFLSI